MRAEKGRRILFCLIIALGMGAMGMSRSAESFVVADAETGYVLMSEQPDEVRQVASLTKVATALVTLRWLVASGVDANHSIPVTSVALAGGINPLKLQPGDTITIESALYASMMASDNSSATVLAEYVGGQLSEGKALGAAAVTLFVKQMNQLAIEIGMRRTQFVNPHGLDGEGALGESTARDMAALTVAAYREPKFVRYCSDQERKVTHCRSGEAIQTLLKNTNELVGHQGIDGVKTGTTRRAGACLIASAKRPEENDDHRLITVVLAADDRFQEAADLIERGWKARDEWVEMGQPIGTNANLPIDAK